MLPEARIAPTIEPAPLDLDALEAKLRATDGIGFMTKLAVKNQVDDLIEQFRSFHSGNRAVSMAVLRERFDLLMMKVVTLIQDTDRPLFLEIRGAREGLWTKLSDPKQFAGL